RAALEARRIAFAFAVHGNALVLAGIGLLWHGGRHVFRSHQLLRGRWLVEPADLLIGSDDRCGGGRRLDLGLDRRRRRRWLLDDFLDELEIDRLLLDDLLGG